MLAQHGSANTPCIIVRDRGQKARTMVPTVVRPSCILKKTARKSVTADICCVTAKVLTTYERKFGSRTYAETKNRARGTTIHGKRVIDQPWYTVGGLDCVTVGINEPMKNRIPTNRN